MPQESVSFGNAKGPIGKWQFPPDAAADASEAPAQDASESAEQGADSTQHGDAPTAAEDAGAGMDEPRDAGAPDKPQPVTALAFEVTTKAIGGKYQPKNVGAIWIADASGKLVKSLEVWAATRVRYLSEYNKTRAGMSVDTTSRATLPNHRAHKVTWDLKDRSGAPVPKGKYKLTLELTDTDSTGKTTSVDFDTSGNASTLMPPDSACFTGMRLELK
jgi:hypothetical protein